MSAKIDLHRLVDELPDAEVAPAQRFLEYLRDSHLDLVQRSLLIAPEDDEPVSQQDVTAIEEAKAAYRNGAYISADEAKREFLG